MFPPEQQQRSLMLEGSPIAATVSQLNPSPHSNINTHKIQLMMFKLWILVARHSTEIIKAQPKQQYRQYSVFMERRLVENSSWMPSSFILFTLLRSLLLLGATCQNINSSVVVFFFSPFPHSAPYSVLLSPAVKNHFSQFYFLSNWSLSFFKLFNSLVPAVSTPFPFPVSVRFSIFLIVLKSWNSVRFALPTSVDTSSSPFYSPLSPC